LQILSQNGFKLPQIPKEGLKNFKPELLGILRRFQAFSHALAFFWLDGFAVRPHACGGAGMN
jgi:hypothetical protein